MNLQNIVSTMLTGVISLVFIVGFVAIELFLASLGNYIIFGHQVENGKKYNTKAEFFLSLMAGNVAALMVFGIIYGFGKIVELLFGG